MEQLFETTLQPPFNTRSHVFCFNYVLIVLVFLLLQMQLKGGQQNNQAKDGVSLRQTSTSYWNLALPGRFVAKSRFCGRGLLLIVHDDEIPCTSITLTELPIRQSRAVLCVQFLLLVRHISKTWISAEMQFSKFWLSVCLELSCNLFRCERSQGMLLIFLLVATE